MSLKHQRNPWPWMSFEDMSDRADHYCRLAIVIISGLS